MHSSSDEICLALGDLGRGGDQDPEIVQRNLVQHLGQSRHLRQESEVDLVHNPEPGGQRQLGGLQSAPTHHQHLSHESQPLLYQRIVQGTIVLNLVLDLPKEVLLASAVPQRRMRL